MLIKEGHVFIYRLYDIAEEIDLKKIKDILKTSARFKLNANKNSVFIKEDPVAWSYPDDEITLGDSKYQCVKLCKVWHYGVLSVCIKINIKDIKIDDLKILSNLIEGNSLINTMASETKDSIKGKISEALIQPAEFEIIEDYTTFVLNKVVDKNDQNIEDPNIVKNEADIASIILAEKDVQISEKLKNNILEYYLQYSSKDMTIIDWNSSVIIDLTDKNDYLEYIDLVEFSLSHLLELRIYDSILDDRLNKLYDSMDNENTSQMDYSGLSKEASQFYIEISEILERVNNSIKTIGDSYYASIIRYINRKFRIEDWEKSTNEKLEKLMDISTILQTRVESKKSDTNIKKSHFYEIVIILLISFEIVQSLWDKFDLKTWFN